MSGQFVPAAVETFEGAATGPGASNGGPVAADAGRALALRDWALAALDGVTPWRAWPAPARAWRHRGVRPVAEPAGLEAG